MELLTYTFAPVIDGATAVHFDVSFNFDQYNVTYSNIDCFLGSLIEKIRLWFELGITRIFFIICTKRAEARNISIRKMNILTKHLE